MISNLLSTCGFNPSEQAVLIHLLKRGATTATLISKATNLKRPTVYAILETLIAQNLVAKQKRKDTTYFASLSPQMISKVLTKNAERKFNDLKTSAHLLETHLDEIAFKSDQDFGVFDIRALDSIDTVYASLETALGGGDYCSIFNPGIVFHSDELKKIGLEHLKESAITKPHIRDIVVDGPEADWFIKNSKNPNHKFKKISADKKILSDMIFMGGSVYLLHYAPSKEVAIKITQPDYFASMMTVFEMLWEQL
ncbi:MAG: helix-turn-helix domain-containing protein [Candidatus Peregrinibacteria bacterium]|nr:helix-turn-helix domain-containing protein [Candidatus Peregrinibacteria bacterium]MDZ4245187.1 helix-turn-helix domain-containing protein [Candidatus Gracilibacteria bacterium]